MSKQQNKDKPKRKYYWFAVEFSMGNEIHGGCYFEPINAIYTVAKGLSKENVVKRMSKNDKPWKEQSYTHWFGRVEKCNRKYVALELIEEWRKETEGLIC